MLGKSSFSSWLLIGAGLAGTLQGAVTGGQTIANNTPKFVTTGKNMGPVAPTSTIQVSVWLNVHNRGELDSVAADLYNPKSPNYRHWLTKSDFVAKFAPTAEEAKTVQDFLTANGLSVVGIGPENFNVTARGTVAAVEKAFHVTLNNFLVNGKMLRGNTSDPFVEGAAGALVGAVYGLDNLAFTHPYVSRTSLPAGKAPPTGGLQGGAALASGAGAGPSANADPAFFTTSCFTGVETESYTGTDYFGNSVSATYKGNGYTKSIEGCGYTPAEIQKAYNLTGLYNEGFDGTGQTIVILDWCGSPTIKSDANAFSARFGLPALTSSNFKIINYPTPSACSSPDPEINIDVEWAHAIAPGASIELVVPPSSSFVDVDNAFLYAAVNQLGSVISGSYGSEESYTPDTILVTENLISEVAAVLGESAQFSSGDEGDFTFDLPQYYSASVSAPADAPWATAVGGVSLALNSNNTIKWQSGWGTNENELIFLDTISDPPSSSGFFNFGSGGGPSAFFKKPWYQASLPGKYRQLPDISWLADPFTGAVIAITEGFTSPPLVYEVYGGTSLACPMFSALWAIANQEAGYPLGQAAQYLYSMPASTITDIVPVNSTTNVTATVVDYLGTTSYTADEIAAPLESTSKFVSTLWNYPLYQDSVILITFGTDSGLTTAKGWDNVTGLGTPNGQAFADYFNFNF